MSGESYHEPVLLDEAISALLTNPNGTYIDGTLGGGGHSAYLLSKLGANSTVFGIDQDKEAIEEAKKRIGDDARFTPVRGNFGYMDTLLSPEYLGTIDGILLDLGVSSHQIDEASRGFSFMQDGPLDMRMGTLTSLTAANVVNEYDPAELRRILYTYGEERFSPKIVQAMVAARPITTTGALRKVVQSVIYGPNQNKSLARVFQALRIEVNRELEMLELALKASLELLKTDGRLVVISYHSLEDRLVKNFIRSGNVNGKVEKDFYGNDLSPMQPMHKKSITATEAEIARNPRSRSAHLRVGIKQEV